jgi:hypothetical protein
MFGKGGEAKVIRHPAISEHGEGDKAYCSNVHVYQKQTPYPQPLAGGKNVSYITCTFTRTIHFVFYHPVRRFFNPERRGRASASAAQSIG